MFRIVIIFGKEDISKLDDILNPDCIVISDVEIKSDKGKAYIPQLINDEEEQLVQLVRGLFVNIKEFTGSETTFGFANSFYECTVAPLMSYLCTLDRILTDLADENELIEVWFPTKFRLLKKYSCYYMGEHESQGKRFYSREMVYLPYLEEICIKHNVVCKYKADQIGILSLYHKIIRLIVVYAWRLIHKIITSSILQPKCKKEFDSIDAVAVLRSNSQAEAAMPFFYSSLKKWKVLVGSTFITSLNNKKIIRKLCENSENIVHQDVKENLSQIIKYYFYALINLVCVPKFTLSYNGVALDLKQAVSEMIVMLPNLEVYKLGMIGAMNNSKVTHKILFSAEQKSAYAYVDAYVAKKIGYKCAAVMQCDQQPRPLPYPVPGDYFLADTLINADEFRKHWRLGADKVKYIGTFKAIPTIEKKSKKYYNSRQRWCFFARVDDLDSNIDVLNILRNVKKEIAIDVIVKLHPRDNIHRYNKFVNDFEIISEGKYEKNELYNYFDFAITSPSGVVLDLIFRDKPFVLLRYGGLYAERYVYTDNLSKNQIHSIMDLASLLRDSSKTMQDFIEFQRRFFIKNSIISDPLKISESFFNLH